MHRRTKQMYISIDIINHLENSDFDFDYNENYYINRSYANTLHSAKPLYLYHFIYGKVHYKGSTFPLKVRDYFYIFSKTN